MPIAVQCLARLLREAPARALFTRASGASLLAPLLRSASSGSGGQYVAPSHQLLYEAGLCAWQLTFYKPAAQAMASSRITPALVNLARHAQKEKVRTLPYPLSALSQYLGMVMPSLHDMLALPFTEKPGAEGLVEAIPACDALGRRTVCCSSQVVRVALLGLKNLLGDASLDVGPEAVEAGLPKVVQQRLLQVRCAASCSAT